MSLKAANAKIKNKSQLVNSIIPPSLILFRLFKKKGLEIVTKSPQLQYLINVNTNKKIRSDINEL
ncbi:hypothetical protein AWW69_06950 [Bacillus cereus]|nr:hypothetical protein AWW69_06950 [Bacillus cereus]